MYKILGILSVCVIFLSLTTAYAAEPIKVTISHTFDDVIYDGEWSFAHEWKASSLDTFRFNGNDLVLRTAHQDDYLYILIDVLGDLIDKNYKKELKTTTYLMSPNKIQKEFEFLGIQNIRPTKF